MAATLRDVAEAAGVSIVTASRVLNGRDTVRVGSRRRVLSAMRKLKYTPNMIARGLSKSRIDVFSVYLWEFDNPFFGRIAFHLLDFFRGTRYEVMFCEDLERTFSINGLFRIAGNLVFCADTDFLLKHRSGEVPMVAVDCRLDRGCGIPSVEIDYTGAYEGICESALKLGHVRPAYLSHVVSRFPELRAGKFSHAEKACAGILGSKPIVFDSAEELSGLFSAKGPRPFDIVLCENDMLAAELYTRIASLGLSVPGDVVVCGCDGTLALRGVWTLKIDPSRIASAAGKMILAAVGEEGIKGNNKKLVKAEVHYG